MTIPKLSEVSKTMFPLLRCAKCTVPQDHLRSEISFSCTCKNRHVGGDI